MAARHEKGRTAHCPGEDAGKQWARLCSAWGGGQLVANQFSERENRNNYCAGGRAEKCQMRSGQGKPTPNGQPTDQSQWGKGTQPREKTDGEGDGEKESRIHEREQNVQRPTLNVQHLNWDEEGTRRHLPQVDRTLRARC